MSCILDARQYDAFGKANVTIRSRTEKIPYQPMLECAVCPGLRDEGQSLEGDVVRFNELTQTREVIEEVTKPFFG